MKPSKTDEEAKTTETKTEVDSGDEPKTSTKGDPSNKDASALPAPSDKDGTALEEEDQMAMEETKMDANKEETKTDADAAKETKAEETTETKTVAGVGTTRM